MVVLETGFLQIDPLITISRIEELKKDLENVVSIDNGLIIFDLTIIVILRIGR